MDDLQDFSILHTYNTEYNADSVEWCPHEPFRHLFVCACYQLTKSETTGLNERIGSILLFSLGTAELCLIQTIRTSAVLDQKWCHNKVNDCSLLGVVNSKKTLEIYILDTELVQLKLVTSCEINTNEVELLLLSLDWSTGKYASDEPEVVCSDSKGYTHRFQFKNNELIQTGSFHGHQYEAWISAFYYWNSNIFFSGGDDCKFLKYDIRAGPAPVSTNLSHEAGVTSMHSNPLKEYSLVSGSYDTYIRLWDIRNFKTPTDSVKMPGTLWRLKWDPIYYKFLLAACMLDGVHICENLTIVRNYCQHRSISYGADWSYMPLEHNERILATCSFYDNLLTVWKTKLS